MSWIKRGLIALAGLGVICAGVLGVGVWRSMQGLYAPAPARTTPLVLRGGFVYPGNGGAVAVGDVVVDGATIACVGTCEAPSDAEIRDVTGSAVLPGLFDVHVHLGVPAGADVGKSQAEMGFSVVRHRPEVRRALLEAGVTSVRSVGDDLLAWTNGRMLLDGGTIAGPKIVMAGPTFTAPGGHPVHRMGGAPPEFVDRLAVQVTDPEVARQEVRALVGSVEGVKIVYDDVFGRLPKLDEAVMVAIAQEAKANGLWVAVHVGTNDDIVDAVAAGADTIEHAPREPLNEEAARALRQPGVTFVPTLALIEALSPDLLELAQDSVRRAATFGVSVAVGSDTQGPEMAFGESTIREMELLLETGLSVNSVVNAATSVGARLARVDDHRGSLEVGKAADLLVVPVGTEGLLFREPSLVLQDGRTYVSR